MASYSFNVGSTSDLNTDLHLSDVGGVAFGQTYPDGQPVPLGVTCILAAPNPQGTCDGVATQGVPRPLSCAKLRETMAATRKPTGDLVGIKHLKGASSVQTMLVPSAANTCVLVTPMAIHAR